MTRIGVLRALCGAVLLSGTGMGQAAEQVLTAGDWQGIRAAHARAQPDGTVPALARQAYFKPNNPDINDRFGWSVAVSGQTVVIGAPYEDSSSTGVDSTPDESATDAGAAYVFVRDAKGVWTQQAYLKAHNTGAGDSYGFSVSVSGDTAVVGAYLEDSSTAGVNNPTDDSGNDVGAAYVYVRNAAGVWSQQAFLKAANAGNLDQFGFTVSISGQTIVVGAQRENSATSGVNSTPNDNGVGEGAAYVFQRSGGLWSQQAYLKASNSQSLDEFGVSVAISGDTIVVGALEEDSASSGVNSIPNEQLPGAGAAYVFARSGGVWSQQAYLKASNPGFFDLFGASVAVSGNTVVVGAYREGSGSTGVDSPPDRSAPDAGAAYVFHRNSSGVWSQQGYLKALNSGSGDRFGHAVAISGDSVIVGAFGEDGGAVGINGPADEAAVDAGAAYAFVRGADSRWLQTAYLKAGNSGANDEMGFTVAVAGGLAVAGARFEDSGSSGPNGVPDDLAGNSGAAYGFSATDLAVTLTDEVPRAVAGGTTTYVLSTRNLGWGSAIGAVVQDIFPAACATVHWTCAGVAGGQCTAQGVGPINNSVVLPAGASVRFTAVCELSPAATVSLVNSASAAAPPGHVDPLGADNQATDSNIIAYMVSGVANPAGGGSVNCQGPVDHGSHTQCSAAPAAGYLPAGLSGCGGVAGAPSPYLTAAITAPCTVTAAFTLQTYSVTPIVGANGALVPASTQTVNHGASASFLLEPQPGYAGTINGNCGGSVKGAIYTTAPVLADCAFAVQFARVSWQVTPSAGPHGSIAPSGVQTVNDGATASFTLSPEQGYAAQASGCGGGLLGQVYTTAPVTADCSVSATFVPVFLVSPAAGPHGSIVPDTPQAVGEGLVTGFRIVPDSGYVGRVSSSCGGSLDGDMFFTLPIVAPCTVTASFSLTLFGDGFE